MGKKSVRRHIRRFPALSFLGFLLFLRPKDKDSASYKRFKQTKRIEMRNSPQRPSLGLSLTPIVIMVVLLFFTIHIFGSDALGGGSQVVLLLTTASCSALAMGFCHVGWKTIENAICTNIFGVTTALLILLLIGALSGSWMVSGVVPSLIYYGMQMLSPTFFLASSCLICAIVSVMTGSSWTTIATIGIALMGIGEALGFPTGWTAGAIISGAYFGDKISPLSDTTVLASSTTDTPLFTHIRYMMYTTVPTMLITLAIFTVAGFMLVHNNSGQAMSFVSSLKETFHLSPALMIVPIVTGILIAKRVPPVITLFVSAMLAAVFALLFQPDLLRQIAGTETISAASMFKGTFMTLYGPTRLDTGNEMLNALIATRGMAGMMDTVWLIICAMCFGGAMMASGMLDTITSFFMRFMQRRAGMVTSTVLSGLTLNICTADQYISIILTGNMFREIYRKKGYESRLLSRTTEDAVTVTSVLIPWNTCGMTQATILSVPTLTYLPYCFFNLISPLMSIFIAILGFKIKKHHEEDQN